MARKNKKDTDKRRAQRVGVPIELSYSTSKKNISKNVTSDDISGIGLGVSLEHPLSVNEEVKILFKPAEASEPIDVVFKVVWCRKESDTSYKVGLELMHTNSPFRFTEFVCDKILDFSFNKEQI